MKTGPFDHLTPFVVQQAVEGQTGLRLLDSLFPYNSYVNRVYGLRSEDGAEYVAKFYRPGRWTPEALEEEHDFLADCGRAELPVALPLADEDGHTLGEVEVETEDGLRTFFFSVSPKKGGRNFDAERDDDWLRLGRLLGRLHQVGRQKPARHREVCQPQTTEQHLQNLLAEGLIPAEFETDFADLADELLPELKTLFAGLPQQRLHGDCHRGNILDRPGEGLLLMDFDDMMWGPVIQDLWLLLPGYQEDCARELDLLTRGYTEFSPLRPALWNLVEPLRFMRMVHYLAWTAKQRHDAGFRVSFPDFGTRSFWIKELEDLRSQADRIFDL